MLINFLVQDMKEIDCSLVLHVCHIGSNYKYEILAFPAQETKGIDYSLVLDAGSRKAMFIYHSLKKKSFFLDTSQFSYSKREDLSLNRDLIPCILE